MRAQVAQIRAAADRVRQLNAATGAVTGAARRAGATMRSEFGTAALSARGLSAAVAGVGAASAGVSGLAAGFARARAELASVTGAVFNLRNLLLAGAAGYGAKLVLDAATFKENTLIAFETLLGSKREADRMLKEAVRFAAATPFETRDVIDAYQRLLTAGFKPVEVPVILKGVGDLAALKGFDKNVIDRVLMAFSQIRAKGRLQGEELLQLAEAGVPVGKVYEVMARRIGKTTDEVQKLISAGRIAPELGITASLEALRDSVSGGKLGSLMDRTSRSISGLWSTLRSRPTELFMDINVEPLRNLLSNLVALTDTSTAVGKRFKAMVERYIGGAVKAVFGSLAETTDPKKAQANIGRFLDWLEQTAQNASQAWRSIKPALLEVWSGFQQGIGIVKGVWSSVRPVLEAVAKAFGGIEGAQAGAIGGTARLVGVAIALAGAWRLVNLVTLGAAGSLVRYGVLGVMWLGRLTIAAVRYAWATRAAASVGVGLQVGVQTLQAIGAGLLRLPAIVARVLPWLFRLAGPWGLILSAAMAIAPLIIRNWDRIRDGAVRALTGIVDWFKALPGRLVEAVRNAGAAFVEALKNVIRQMPGGDLVLRGLEAVGGAAHRAYEWGRGVMGQVVQGGKDALGIRSPSREFMRMGLAAVAGFSLGLGQVAPVERAVRQLASVAAAPVAASVNVAGAPASLTVAPAAQGNGPVTVHITIDGARQPGEIVREVVQAIDHWAAGRIVVLGLEHLASEGGHDA